MLKENGRVYKEKKKQFSNANSQKNSKEFIKENVKSITHKLKKKVIRYPKLMSMKVIPT